MTRLMWSLLVCVAFGLQLSSAQNEPLLSGSEIKSENIISKSDAIFEGKISKMRLGSITATDRVAYIGVQIGILQLLKGSIDMQISVTMNVAAGHEVHEESPEVGTLYIFFVKKNAPGQPDPYTVLKLLPATDANIAKVKALIAAAPASK